MASVKRTVIDTDKTSASEFLAGGPVAAPVATPSPAGVPAEPPGSSVPVASIAPSVPPDPTVPFRPGLEIQPPVNAMPEPFELLSKWVTGDKENGFTIRNLRAMPVPGGCLVRLTSVRGNNFADSICFVPHVTVRDGKLCDDEGNGTPNPA